MPQITHVPAMESGVLVHIPVFSPKGFVLVKGKKRRTVAQLYAPIFVTRIDALAAGFPRASVEPKAFGSTWRGLLRQRERYAEPLRRQLS